MLSKLKAFLSSSRKPEPSQPHHDMDYGFGIARDTELSGWFLADENALFRGFPIHETDKVLDVGCGWGLAGLYCRKRFHSVVTASDADPAVFPYLQAQADINDLTIDTEVWRFADVPGGALAAADTLIASDICFWDDMAEEVYQLIARAVEAGCGRILIADPGRPPFLAVAEACIEDFYAELVPVKAHTSRPHRGYVLRIENA